MVKLAPWHSSRTLEVLRRLCKQVLCAASRAPVLQLTPLCCSVLRFILAHELLLRACKYHAEHRCPAFRSFGHMRSWFLGIALMESGHFVRSLQASWFAHILPESTSLEHICLRSHNYVESVARAFRASFELAEVRDKAKLRSFAERLDGLFTRLEIWLANVGYNPQGWRLHTFNGEGKTTWQRLWGKQWIPSQNCFP
jgi:hypothetical protein